LAVTHTGTHCPVVAQVRLTSEWPQTHFNAHRQTDHSCSWLWSSADL